jgi:hypothetical protein
MPTSGIANRVLVVRTANADPTYDQVDWNTDIKNKPSTFPPSAHTHYRSDITDFWSSPFWTNIPDKPSTFPPSAHASSHASGGSDPVSLDASQITSGRLSLSRMPTSGIANRVLVVRTANADPTYDQVDWNTDIKNKPSTFPPSAHTHYRSDITDFWSSPFWTNIPDKPSTFPPSAHTHYRSDIIDFAHTHSRTDITDFWSSPFWTNIPDKPSTFPPSAHTHSRSDVTDFGQAHSGQTFLINHQPSPHQPTPQAMNTADQTLSETWTT